MHLANIPNDPPNILLPVHLSRTLPLPCCFIFLAGYNKIWKAVLPTIRVKYVGSKELYGFCEPQDLSRNHRSKPRGFAPRLTIPIPGPVKLQCTPMQIHPQSHLFVSLELNEKEKTFCAKCNCFAFRQKDNILSQNRVETSKVFVAHNGDRSATTIAHEFANQ